MSEIFITTHNNITVKSFKHNVSEQIF